jgi:beta-galactosidase
VQQRVDFKLSGPAVWRGGYCSGKTNSINHTFLDLECGINRVALRSTRSPGSIGLTAESPKLKCASLALNSVRVDVQGGGMTQLPAMPSRTASVAARPGDPGQISLSGPAIHNGHCLKTFSYSGPTTMVCVQEDAKDGSKIYADRNATFENLPSVLVGCDWVQAANADKLYSAVDLIELAANADTTVYIAHDDRLPRPDWLQRQFSGTQTTIMIEGKPMRVFKRQIRNGESLTLGSNAEDGKYNSCNMYVVFLKVGGSDHPKPAGS